MTETWIYKCEHGHLPQSCDVTDCIHEPLDKVALRLRAKIARIKSVLESSTEEIKPMTMPHHWDCNCPACQYGKRNAWEDGIAYERRLSTEFLKWQATEFRRAGGLAEEAALLDRMAADLENGKHLSRRDSNDSQREGDPK